MCACIICSLETLVSQLNKFIFPHIRAQPSSYRCNLCWKDEKTLLVGWVATVCICVIRKRSPVEMSNGSLPEHVVEAGKGLNELYTFYHYV